MALIRETFSRKNGTVQRLLEVGDFASLTSTDLRSELDHDQPDHDLWWNAVLRGCSTAFDAKATLTSVDLFSSVGGLTLGAKFAAEAVRVNMRTELAIDVDQDALDVFQLNFPGTTTRQSNLSSCIDYHVYGRSESAELAYPPEILDPILAAQTDHVDLMLAGPPCQGHSNLNNHTRRSDSRNQLYVTAAVTAIALHAPMIVIENVPDVVQDKVDVVGTALTLLKKNGYHISTGVVNAAAIGAPQTRRRHFAIATLQPHIPLIEVAAQLKRPPMTLRSVIGDLENVETMGYMDEASVLSPENEKRVDYLHDEDEYDLPREIRPLSHRDGHTYPSVYGRLYWDRPAPTITTGFMTPGRGRYVHPSRKRVLTAREAARIQGFPDSFAFGAASAPQSRKLLSKWIGDAVPSQLGYLAVLTAFTSMDFREIADGTIAFGDYGCGSATQLTTRGGAAQGTTS